MKNKNLAKIEEIIAEAKAGRMFILVDDENRENEGDLVIPAQFCDDKAVNFMAKFGRGLICLALDEKRVQELDLPLMAMNNQSRNRTAFTVSIEAREGISTGISAADRAKTVSAAINPALGKNALVSPGHIFPLRAQNGGVLIRAGHTEASVDIARLAGLNPSAVICEIMKDDGQMARLPDLIKFARKHNLKIATIADLIEYRRKNERFVEAVYRRQINSKNGGEFELIAYQNSIDGTQHIALVKGKINAQNPVLVRMHHLNIIDDCLMDLNSDKNGLLAKAMKKIEKNGAGIIVIIRQPNEKLCDLFGDDNGGIDSQKTLRNYGIGAQILTDLGVKDMLLLTNSKKSVIGIEGYDLRIVGYRKI